MNELLRPALNDAGVMRLYKILGSESGLALVGGCVRELLKYRRPTDIDLAVRFEPQRVKSMLEAAGIRVVETGIAHGTVLAVIESAHYELTTFRKPGSRTQSEFSDSLEKDLEGRDFTINAIAFDLRSEKLVDPFGGIEDLDNDLLRAVGDAETRFREDPLRLLRMVRFGHASGRVVEMQTEGAATHTRELLSDVSIERVRTELEHILMAPCAREGFRALERLGMMSLTLPELQSTVGIEQNDFHVHDVFEHTLDVINNCPFDRLLRLTALFHDIAKPATLTVGDNGARHFYLHEKVGAEMCRAIMMRLKYSQEDIETVALLVDTHMRPLSCGPQGVRRLMRELGGHLDRWLEFKHADKPPRGEEREFQEGLANFLRLLDEEKHRTVGSVFSALAIRGDDLINLGVPKGPRIGQILKALNDEVLEVPDRNTREFLLARVAEILKSSASIN